jgi:hypothetical protein
MLWRGPMGGGAASGRIGAMVAGHCAQGQYLKSRVKPVNPNSTFQHPNRNSLRALAVQWGQLLTSTQRDSWATYAANVTWLNRLGDTVHLSGQMEFIRSNWLREHANLDAVLDAPTTFDRSSVGPAPTLSLSPGMTTGTLTMDVTAPWVDYSTQTALLLFVGIPRSGGITFMKRRTRRCAVVRASVMPLPNFTFTLPFTTPDFGQAWPAWVVATMADGRMTTPMPLTPVITDPPPPPWSLWFSDSFTYTNGSLWGKGSWIAPPTFPDSPPQVVSHTVHDAAGDNFNTENTSPSLPPDSVNGFRVDVTLSFGTIDETLAHEMSFQAGLTGDSIDWGVNIGPGDIPGNVIGSINISDQTGVLATFGPIPWYAPQAHTISIRLWSGGLHLYVDGIHYGSAPTTANLADGGLFFNDNTSSSPNTTIITNVSAFAGRSP